MAYDTGFSRRSSSERDLQPVAIVSIDPTSRMAVGATRTRHTIRINCAYATGDTITVPAVGEQWYVERFDAEWRLYGRIPFNDPTLNIEPEEGQVSVGSASGPLELNGTEVRANGTFRLDGVYFRDTGTQFERSTDKKTWTAIGGGAAGMVQIIAEALAHYTGTDQALAAAALKSWGGGLDKVAENFTLLWDLLCGNVFVSGLKRLGVGASDVERIIDGFQNFINYLFGVVFCDFTGDLDPQTILARLRDLLAPVINNPLVQALATVATALEVGTGNLLNNVVAGLTGLFDVLRDLFLVNPFNIDSLTAFQDAVAKVATVVAAVGDQALAGIVGLFGDVLNGIVNNPITLIIKEFFNNSIFNPVLGEDPETGDPVRLFDAITNGSLFTQIVNGTQTIFYTIAKVVTEVVLPIDPSDWQTLLPFIPAEVWAGIAAATLPDFGEGFLGGLGVILKIAFKALENFLALGVDAISNFFKNIVTLFGNLSSFFTVLFTSPQDAINYFLTDVLKIAEMSVDGVVTFISDFIGNAGGAITTLVENLLALFGIDFTPTDPVTGEPVAFNAATALTTFVNKFLVDGLGGIFGATVTEVTRFITRLKNFFGSADFFTSGIFDFASAASGFINNVLINAPALAIQTLSSALNIAGTLLYDFVKGCIELFSKVPLIGPPVASFATNLLNNFVILMRGNINSGTNLLADAGAEKSSFWNQTGVTWSSAPKRSGGGSVQVSGGYFAWWNVNDIGERSPIRTQPSEYLHAECYVYSYYSSTVYLYARAENSITGDAYDYYLTSGSANSSGWTKVQADIQMPATHPTTGQPSGWDRVSFGLYAANYPTYIDDMLAREITAAQVVKGNLTVLNQALYQTDTTPAGTTPKINVGVIPTGIPATSVNSPTGSGTVGSDINSVYNTLTGNTSGTGTGGLVATVGNASSGLVNKTNTIVTSTFNAWYGSGSSGTASEMGQVIGSIKTTVSNTWTVEVLPYGTTTWTRPVPTAQILEFWVICVGSGGGGGKGQVGYPGQTNPGGNGGLGGKWFAKQLNPSILPATVNVGIGAGGAGKTSGTVDAANNRADTRFGYGYEAHSVTTGEIQTASVASIISFYAATDSQPGDGGTGATGNGSGVQAGFGESTPLATGGLGGISAGGGGGSGSVGGSGGDANNLGQLRAGGGGGGGGGAGTYQNGGNGGSGGVPGGGGGGGGGSWASGGPVGGNGGTGGHGCIILLYRKTS